MSTRPPSRPGVSTDRASTKQAPTEPAPADPRTADSGGEATVDVAVVGAGLAGLVAARRLQLEGLRVVVFDKGRGPGGRTSLRRADPFAFDHGAQYFTVRDGGFERSVRAWQRRGVVSPWEPRLAVLGPDAPQADDAAGRDGSGARGSATRERVERFVGLPGMNALAKDLARGLDVRCGVRIGSARAGQAGGSLSTWRLADVADQPVARARQLLVTTPPEQAAPLLADAPELAHVVETVPMAPCIAVLLGFDAPLELPVDAAFVHGGPLAWVARNSSKPGRPKGEAWVLHAGPDWSRQHFEDPPEDNIERLRVALDELFGRALPRPALAQAHRWKYAAPEPARDDVALVDPSRGVGVAGDWLNGGRVEGAFLSGARAAELLLAAQPRGAAR